MLGATHRIIGSQAGLSVCVRRDRATTTLKSKTGQLANELFERFTGWLLGTGQSVLNDIQSAATPLCRPHDFSTPNTLVDACVGRATMR